MKLTKKNLRDLIKESLDENALVDLYSSIQDISNKLQMGDADNRQKATGEILATVADFLVDSNMDYVKLKNALTVKINSASRTYDLKK